MFWVLSFGFALWFVFRWRTMGRGPFFIGWLVLGASAVGWCQTFNGTLFYNVGGGGAATQQTPWQLGPGGGAGAAVGPTAQGGNWLIGVNGYAVSPAFQGGSGSSAPSVGFSEYSVPLVFYSVGPDYECDLTVGNGYDTTQASYAKTYVVQIFAGADYDYGFDFVWPDGTFTVRSLSGTYLSVGTSWSGGYVAEFEPDGVSQPLSGWSGTARTAPGYVLVSTYPQGGDASTQPSTRPVLTTQPSDLLPVLRSAATRPAWGTVEDLFWHGTFISTPPSSSEAIADGQAFFEWVSDYCGDSIDTSSQTYKWLCGMLGVDPGSAGGLSSLCGQLWGSAVLALEHNAPGCPHGIRADWSPVIFLVRCMTSGLLLLGFLRFQWLLWNWALSGTGGHEL